MLDNTGKKLKLLAKMIFIIEIILSFILAIVLAAISDDYGFWIFILVLAIGFVANYILYLFLASFGELVESSVKASEKAMEITAVNKEILTFLKSNTQPVNPKPAYPLPPVSESNTSSVNTPVAQPASNMSDVSQTQDNDEKHRAQNIIQFVLHANDYTSVLDIKNDLLSKSNPYLSVEKAPDLFIRLDHMISNEQFYGSMIDSAKKVLAEYAKHLK